MTMQFPERLVVMALDIESRGVFEGAGVSVLYTGVGKVNAAAALARRLAEYRCSGRPMPLVVNFGSAGSRLFTAGSVVACRRFVQRDIDVSGLGFPVGVTPVEDGPHELEFPAVFAGLPEGICGTGDSFAMGAPHLPCDVIDMEAYALAKACRHENARFACAKYITDGADHAAAGDWRANVKHAPVEFLRLYRMLRDPG